MKQLDISGYFDGGEDEALVFDALRGELFAREGMTQASSALRVQDWKTQASALVDAIPTGVEFTLDDVVGVVGLPDRGVNRNNVVGAFASGMSRRPDIVWTGRFTKSTRMIRHRGTQRVWRKR